MTNTGPAAATVAPAAAMVAAMVAMVAAAAVAGQKPKRGEVFLYFRVVEK